MKIMTRDQQAERGFTVVELLATILVVSVLLVVITQMLSIIVRENLENQRRVAAIELSKSMMEVLTSIPVEQLDETCLERPDVRQLIGAQPQTWSAQLQVTDTDQPAAGKRLELTLSPSTNPRGDRPLVIVGWKFAEASP